jgi:hypothetical protein
MIAPFITIPVGNQYYVSIESDMSCADCNQYATEFFSILNGAHWQIIMPKVMGAAAASPKGIAILTPDPANPLPEATALIRGLNEAKVPFDLKAGSGGLPGTSPMAAILITARSSF